MYRQYLTTFYVSGPTILNEFRNPINNFQISDFICTKTITGYWRVTTDLVRGSLSKIHEPLTRQFGKLKAESKLAVRCLLLLEPHFGW